MPSFTNPTADAEESYQALRGLAHATRVMDPADTYTVLGNLLAATRALGQVLDQLATAHEHHLAAAFDDHGDHAAGLAEAVAAGTELREVATLIEVANGQIDTALSHSGRIAWHPQPAETTQAQTAPEPGRWISVVFLQGADADELLDRATTEGAEAVIEHLAGHDMGEETVQAALVNGYVYDTPPVGVLDRVAARDVYTLVYNPFAGHLNLLRRHDEAPDPALSGITDPAPAHAPGLSEPMQAPAGQAGSGVQAGRPDPRPQVPPVQPPRKPAAPVKPATRDWFGHRRSSSSSQGRSL